MNTNSNCRIAQDVVILPGAHIVGDVQIDSGCSVWFNAVIRGDESGVTIGEDTNIQDNCTLHTSHTDPLRVGRRVTVGHNAVLHGCTVGDNCLIGMGAIVMDGAVVGRNCIVAAGALVPGGMVIPEGSLVVGSPAKLKRSLTQEEVDSLQLSTQNYLNLKELYR